VTIEIVSASAGTGKTHRLTGDLVKALLDGSARPEGVVAITYTVKAAAELESRIRGRLLEEGRADLAARVRDGYIGTIHSVCQRLLREFALDAGLSPYLEPIPEGERQRLFEVAMAAGIAGRETELNALAMRLSFEDWPQTLREIVDAARNNGMDAAAFARSAQESQEGLQRLLGPPTMDEPTYLARLKAAHGKLQPKLDEMAAGTVKADKDRCNLGQRLKQVLDRGELPSWHDQVQFAKAVDPKKLQTWAGELIAVVNEHLTCASFQADLRNMQQALFDLAGHTLDVFVKEKAAAGVVDFGDMLAIAHDILKVPTVVAALTARLDLVLVDELQDTSPLQLAVISALAGLSRRNIWVGDRKQAIFGFQGSDPVLMAAAMDAALAGRPPEILSESYRSRPGLVELCSTLFTAALAPHGFPAEQVQLTPAKKDPASLGKQPVAECWQWTPEKVDRNGTVVKASEAHALAAGVEALLAQPPLVRERDAADRERTRPASRRDVAILARSNDRCREIAEALRARGIPVRVSLSGLTQTREGVLACAALALLADPSDGVAAFEVSWLGGRATAAPDAWLSRRLDEVAQWRQAAEQAAAKGERRPARPAAFNDDPRVAALQAATAEAARLSPAEALDLALHRAGVPARVRSWPEPEQRLANLEALRAAARGYEQLCAAQSVAATTLGLVAHLHGLSTDKDADKQAAASLEDAVTVVTWHKAKGLEWPIVVLAHLDHSRPRFAFAMCVESAPAFDFKQPLANRWIRWWPWPYGGISTNLALLDRAQQTPEIQSATERDLAERLRLLYVGFTRPRDMLVLAAKVTSKNGAETDALAPLQDAAGKQLLATPFALPTPGKAEVAINGKAWPCGLRQLSGLPPVAMATRRADVRWYAAGTPVQVPSETVNPSGEPLPGAARIVQINRIGNRHPAKFTVETAGPLGDAVHAFLAADRSSDVTVRTVMATRLIDAEGVSGAIAPETLLAAADGLRTWLDARYPGATWHREWPIRARLATTPPRLVVGEVDLYLDLPDGFVLVDHKSFPGSESERDRRLIDEYAPQLRWYAKVLADALKKPLKAAYIHLPIRGEMAEVELGA
jgi:ATP-dependent helicase/nuclease subunit A